MRGTTFSRRHVLSAVSAVAGSAVLAEALKAAAPEPSGAGPEPTSWVGSAMPEVTHRMIETNGIRLHVAEQGDGPLIILCHGFPECWYSWRHQLPALANAGFRAVAPDLRGYGQSDRPEEMEKYTILDDIGDIVGLVDALGTKQAVIAGHDIGAAIAWQTAVLRPDICRAVIALSPPFRSRGFGDSGPPTTLMPRTENAMFYQLFLQTPEAEADSGLTFLVIPGGWLMIDWSIITVIVMDDDSLCVPLFPLRCYLYGAKVAIRGGSDTAPSSVQISH